MDRIEMYKMINTMRALKVIDQNEWYILYTRIFSGEVLSG